MGEYLISVVIPVYNGERFVSKAIESVLTQMVGEIEVLLVNDGSNDNSREILDKYAEYNERVYVIHKQNGGISSARNAGIAAAHGEYIMFLDADDYLDEDAFSKIISVIGKYHPDCIDFGWRYVSNGETMPDRHHKLPKNVLMGEHEIKNDIMPPLLNLKNDPDYFIFDFSCNKVFRRNIIRDNNIKFDETRRVWEDRPFVVKYLRYCKNYYSMDQSFYNYVNIPGSLSRRFNLDYFRIIIENFRLYYELWGDLELYNFYSDYANRYWAHSIENMIFCYLDQKKNRKQIRNIIMDTLCDEQVQYWLVNRVPDNSFELQISNFIATYQIKKALLGYQKKHTIDCFKLKVKKTVIFMKRILKKIKSLILG